MRNLYPIKTSNPYVSGIIEKDIRLTLRERLAILFHGGIRITMVSEPLWKEYVLQELEQKGR